MLVAGGDFSFRYAEDFAQRHAYCPAKARLGLHNIRFYPDPRRKIHSKYIETICLIFRMLGLIRPVPAISADTDSLMLLSAVYAFEG